MLRVILQGLVLRRRAYLRMVLAGEGVADAALVVGVVYLLLAVPGILGSSGLLATAVVRGRAGSSAGSCSPGSPTWSAGTCWRATAPSPASWPPPAWPFLPCWFRWRCGPFLSSFVALAVASGWLLACLWQAARVSLDLSPGRAAAAAAGGYGGWLALSALAVI